MLDGYCESYHGHCHRRDSHCNGEEVLKLVQCRGVRVSSESGKLIPILLELTLIESLPRGIMERRVICERNKVVRVGSLMEGLSRNRWNSSMASHDDVDLDLREDNLRS